MISAVPPRARVAVFGLREARGAGRFRDFPAHRAQRHHGADDTGTAGRLDPRDHGRRRSARDPHLPGTYGRLTGRCVRRRSPADKRAAAVSHVSTLLAPLLARYRARSC